jgi:choline dehydrogenase-like flavoprotein
VITGCFVERVLTDAGRASGVAGVSPVSGARLTVRAPHVVLAAGSLESPGVQLRSGIGGPAVGRHLRLHPCTAVMGSYGQDMQAWWGPPHAALIDEFAAGDGDGYGFLIEGVQYTTGLGGSAIPWRDAQQHKQTFEDFRNASTLIGLVRDRGEDNGRVELDASGMAQPFYSMLDPRDRAMTGQALDAQIRVHAAAGAHQISVLADSMPIWHRGEDLEAFIARARRIPLRAGGMRLFAAHQMGTCRLGADPSTSAAGPTGELHDTSGVWIGDASAFPTASGTNPMITIMALAHRTAEHIAQAAGAAAPTTPALQEA